MVLDCVNKDGRNQLLGEGEEVRLLGPRRKRRGQEGEGRAGGRVEEVADM